jgi:hypothetical protein
MIYWADFSTLYWASKWPVFSQFTEPDYLQFTGPLKWQIIFKIYWVIWLQFTELSKCSVFSWFTESNLLQFTEPLKLQVIFEIYWVIWSWFTELSKLEKNWTSLLKGLPEWLFHKKPEIYLWCVIVGKLQVFFQQIAKTRKLNQKTRNLWIYLWFARVFCNLLKENLQFTNNDTS